jgi:hypothetical protein
MIYKIIYGIAYAIVVAFYQIFMLYCIIINIIDLIYNRFIYYIKKYLFKKNV